MEKPDRTLTKKEKRISIPLPGTTDDQREARSESEAGIFEIVKDIDTKIHGYYEQV